MAENRTRKNSPVPIDISRTKIILDQMMNCICKIKIKDTFGTGFFCEIRIYNESPMKVFMTNCHVLNDIDYCTNKELNIVLNDDKEKKTINLGIERKTYFNIQYDIAIIELKESDNINNFLELDDNLFESEKLYKDASLYILQYPFGDKAQVSYGKLIDINSYEIKHICNTEHGSSGSPILNLSNNKVIGIHRQSSDNISKGTFLRYPLINFFVNKMEGWTLKKFDEKINIKDSKEKKDLAMKDLFEEMKNILKPGKPRINILFENISGYPDFFNLTVSYGTTLDQLLKYCLKRINSTELIGTDKIRFLYEARSLVFGDKTPIEKYFKNNINPKIVVVCFSNINYWTKEEEDIIKKEEDKIFSEVNDLKVESESESEQDKSIEEKKEEITVKFNKNGRIIKINKSNDCTIAELINEYFMKTNTLNGIFKFNGIFLYVTDTRTTLSEVGIKDNSEISVN